MVDRTDFRIKHEPDVEYLHRIIHSAENCQCDYECYCQKNMEYAKRELAKIKQMAK